MRWFNIAGCCLENRMLHALSICERRVKRGWWYDDTTALACKFCFPPHRHQASSDACGRRCLQASTRPRFFDPTVTWHRVMVNERWLTFGRKKPGFVRSFTRPHAEDAASEAVLGAAEEGESLPRQTSDWAVCESWVKTTESTAEDTSADSDNPDNNGKWKDLPQKPGAPL